MKIFQGFLKILIITTLSISVSSCSQPDQDSADSPSAASITTAEAEIRNLSDEFTVSSEVTAYKRVYVASRISGVIEEVNFEEGDHVNPGDVMARLDVREQEINLRRAITALNEAEDVYRRIESLFKRDAVAEAEYLSAKRALEQAEAEVEHLKLLVEYGEIKAPISGVVTARLVEMGNNVSANERMFTIADLDLLVTHPGVSELNLAGLEESQHVDVRLDVYPDVIFPGTIRRIFPAVDALTRLFTVEVELIQEYHLPAIRPGYLARVRFATDDRPEVITVPSEAVYRLNGESYLFVLSQDETSVSLNPVEVGVQRDGFAEIREGLEAGMKVAASNLEALEDGAHVQIVGTFRRHGFRN